MNDTPALIPALIVLCLFLISGILSLCAAIADWNWFFNSKNCRMLLRKLFSSRTFLFFVFRPAAFSAVIFIRQSAYSQMTSRMNSVNPENSFSVAMRPWLMSTNSCGQASVPLR